METINLTEINLLVAKNATSNILQEYKHSLLRTTNLLRQIHTYIDSHNSEFQRLINLGFIMNNKFEFVYMDVTIEFKLWGDDLERVEFSVTYYCLTKHETVTEWFPSIRTVISYLIYNKLIII